MLRSASWIVPLWRARPSVSACSGFSSSVAVLPTSELLPSFSFGPAGAGDEIAVGARRRPDLPLQIFRLDHLAEPEVVFRDKNFCRRQLRNRLDRTGRVVRSAGEIGCNATGAKRDGQDDDTCDIHKLRSTLTPECPNCTAMTAFPGRMTRHQRYKGT